MLTELFPGSHPFCIRWFPVQWAQDPDGSIDYGTPILGYPIVGWRAWHNLNKFVDSTGATPLDPKLNLILDSIQGICWYHQPPYKTMMGGMDLYFLPDGTTRTSGSVMSDTAWEQLSQKIVDDNAWPA